MSIMCQDMKSQQKEQSSSVSFCDHVDVICILHINDYTTSEIDASWYNKNDLAKIKQENRATAQLFMEGNCGNEISSRSAMYYCTRGLESFTTEGRQRKAETKRKAREVVMDEQDLEEATGISDPAHLASMYHSYTRKSQMEAQTRALQDERDVQTVSLKNEEPLLRPRPRPPTKTRNSAPTIRIRAPFFSLRCQRPTACVA